MGGGSALGEPEADADATAEVGVLVATAALLAEADAAVLLAGVFDAVAVVSGLVDALDGGLVLLACGTLVLEGAVTTPPLADGDGSCEKNQAST